MEFIEADGIRRYADGREVCQTNEAWNRRRQEVFQRDGGRCQCVKDCRSHFGRQCGKILAFNIDQAIERHCELGTVHHKIERGMGGGTRDDRMENLELQCWMPCHIGEKP